MTHDQYFDEAIKLAKRASQKNEVPIGAVVVDATGEIIGRGYNQTKLSGDVTKHAEIVALRQAAKKIGDWRLDQARLYVTLEPCVMCLGASLISRIKEVHFILDDSTFGSLRSVLKRTSIKGAYKNLRFIQHKKRVSEVTTLMQTFFKQLRSK